MTDPKLSEHGEENGDCLEKNYEPEIEISHDCSFFSHEP